MSMPKNVRLWLGLTFVIILGVNYTLVGFPLYSKANSVSDAAKAIYLKQLKQGDVLKGTRDDYLLEVFRREKHMVDRSLLLLNCISISALVIIVSWTALGLVLKRKDEFIRRK